MAEKQMSNVELAIQRELGCHRKEFKKWAYTGSVSNASALGYLAFAEEPNLTKVTSLGQSSVETPQLPRSSLRLQNRMWQSLIKDEPYSTKSYSGPKSPTSTLKDCLGPNKPPKEKCPDNSIHEGPFSIENPMLGRTTPPPRHSPKPDPIQETNTARFQLQSPNSFPSVPTKLRSGLKRKGEENEESTTSKKSVDSLFCELCQATCSGALVMQQHLNGRPHKSKLEWYKLQRHRGGPGTKKPTCKVCQIWCSDGNSLEMHIKGQKHKSKVQELETCKRNGGAVVDKKPILCEMCGVHCMNEDIFKMHLKGKQHALKGRLISW